MTPGEFAAKNLHPWADSNYCKIADDIDFDDILDTIWRAGAAYGYDLAVRDVLGDE